MEATAADDAALHAALQDQAHAKMSALGAEWGLVVSKFSIEVALNRRRRAERCEGERGGEKGRAGQGWERKVGDGDRGR